MYAIIRGKLFKQICEWVQLQVVLVCLDKPKSKEPSIPPYVTRLQHLLVFQPRTVLASRSTVDKVDGHRWLPWLGKACLDTLHGSGTSPLLQMHIVYTTSSFKSANSEAYYSSIRELPLWIMQKVQSCRVVPGWFCFSKSIRLQVDQQHRRKDDDPLPIIRNRLSSAINDIQWKQLLPETQKADVSPKKTYCPNHTIGSWGISFAICGASWS